MLQGAEGRKEEDRTPIGREDWGNIAGEAFMPLVLFHRERNLVIICAT
jgi:hypothetical protein